MRKFFAEASNCAIRLALLLLAVFTGPSSPGVGRSDQSRSHALACASSTTPACEAAWRTFAGLDDTMLSAEGGFSHALESNFSPAAPTTPEHGSTETDYNSTPSSPATTSARARASDELVVEPASETAPGTEAEIIEARAYLIETASPGYTMTLQGPELAIGRLHPEFAIRLAGAIREARSAGLPLAGVFSAYRPPAFGVGGFSDKFNSLHTYGLAVDMHGIGSPGSPEAQLWHRIAAKNGVVCPYGPRDRAEWNHCQPTSVKILAENPLRETVSSAGPLDLESMFEAGNSMIEDIENAADSPTPIRTLEAAAKHPEPVPHIVASRRIMRNSREAAKSVRHAKFVARGGKETPTIAIGKHRVAAAKSVRHTSSVKGRPVIAVEEGRRKSKSGRA